MFSNVIITDADLANYKKGNSTWDNSLDIGYGLLQQGEDKVRKTDDKIDFTSKYGQKAFKNWYYAGLLNFKSQMAPGFNYPDDSTEISRFLAPAYVWVLLVWITNLTQTSHYLFRL